VRSQRLQCRAAAVQENRFHQSIGAKLAAAGAAALLSLSTAGASLANEFDLLASETPTNNYLIDDAGVLNRTTKKNVNQDLEKLEKETGYRLEVATVRKLETENDAFAFGDKLVEKWYKTVDVGNNKGVLLIVTSAKEGALTGGPGFLKAVGDGLIDSVVSDSIPILTEQEKFNETVTSIVKRVGAVLNGQADPGAPIRAVNQTGRTYKTKDETAKSKNVTGTIVLVLLGISVVVPMLQYWGYTSKD
jgi:uncharacterized membrane protein YgcG